MKRSWYDNGNLESEGNDKDGRQDGLWNTWYENGKLRYYNVYKDGRLLDK